jgi:hypothetical protein
MTATAFMYNRFGFSFSFCERRLRTTNLESQGYVHCIVYSVVDRHRFDAELDKDSTLHFDADSHRDLNPDPNFYKF